LRWAHSRQEVLKGALSHAHTTATAARQAARSARATDWAAASFPWSAQVGDLLRTVFKLAAFRPPQAEIINATLAGRDVFVVMPTGGGKSLCYQLPALISPGVTVVISPLVALMDDQLAELARLRIAAARLTSETGREEAKAVREQLMDPAVQHMLLFITPEKLAKNVSVLVQLEKLYTAGRLARLVVDEAHCCSEWGHDFRTDYKSLGAVRAEFPKTPLLALTATASPKVQADVEAILRIEGCEVFRTSFDRPNLDLQVVPKPAEAADALAALVAWIRHEHPADTGLVYCFSRKDAEQVAAGLADAGIAALCYHASLPPEERRYAYEAWSAGAVKVVVATIAFGLGINKANVRYVLHHSLSKSLENYYQEAGRAGRDGQPATCVLFYRPADVFRVSTLVFGNRTGLASLYEMVRYCHDRRTCRRLQLARHFQDPAVRAPCGGRCDTCRGSAAAGGPAADVDVTGPVIVLLAALQQAECVAAAPCGGGYAVLIHARAIAPLNVGHGRAESTDKRTALKVMDMWRAAWRAAVRSPPPALGSHGTPRVPPGFRTARRRLSAREHWCWWRTVQPCLRRALTASTCSLCW